MNKALFLDRDGVINVDYGHVHTIEKFDFVDGIFEFCRSALNHGYIIIVVTNQAGIGKGLYTLFDFNLLNSWMIDEFKKNNIKISKTYYCPHRPSEKCRCRKPNPGMILEAIKDFNVDVSKSILIGDKISDVLAGDRAGIGTTILFNQEKGNSNFFEIRKILK